MTKTAKNKRKKALPFKTSNCSPGTRKNKQTCYSHSSLLKLRDYWNARHPDVKITSNKSNEIWKSLKTNMEDVCNTERCWLRQKFVKNNLANKLSHAFAPSVWLFSRAPVTLEEPPKNNHTRTIIHEGRPTGKPD